MGMLKKGVIAFALFFLAAGFMGCKSAPKASAPVLTPQPSGQVQYEKNPFTVLLVQEMDAKDTLLGRIAERLDTYKPKAGQTDFSGLAKTALSPFTKVDSLMADVFSVSMIMQKQADGSYAFDQNGKQASLKANGQQMEYAAKVADAQDQTVYTRQIATYLADGNRMTVQVFDKAKNRGEITIVCMQWIKDGASRRMQYYYTEDDGDTYNLLRVQITDYSLIFAIYEQVSEMPNLFTLPSQDLFKTGYITYATFENNTVTIQNGSQTLTVGP